MKTTRRQLERAVREELITYLGSGKPINESILAEALDYTSLNIDDFDRLKGIHFVLTKEVQRYLEKLPQRLRRIRTTNEVQEEQVHGEIRGAIDWGQTIRGRYSGNVKDKTFFVTRSPYTEYQLPENLLLKKFLATVRRITVDDIRQIEQPWRQNRFDDNEIVDFDRLFSKNVHLDRINASADTELKNRDLNAARLSRQPLYFRAYDLYDRYQRFLSNDLLDADIIDVLDETLVVPEQERLFELFCVFRMISLLRNRYPIRLRPIGLDSNTIAKFESSEIEIRVYHTKTGKVKFHEPVEADRNLPSSNFAQRYTRARLRHQQFTGLETPRALFGGIPDLIIEFYQKSMGLENPSHVVIGEVKYTDSTSTFREGALELMEYLEFARIGETNYLQGDSHTTLSGIIFTDDVGRHAPIQNVHHLNSDDLRSESSVLDGVLPRPLVVE